MQISWTYERIWMAIFAVASLLIAGNALRAFQLEVSEFSESIVIEAPAATIWPFLVEADLRKRWQTGLTDVVIMTGEAAEPGSTALLMFHQSGEVYEVDEELVEAGPPNRLTLVNRTVRTEDRIAWSLAAVEGGTEVQCRIKRRAGAFADRYVAFYTDWQDGRGLRLQLERLKQIASE